MTHLASFHRAGTPPEAPVCRECARGRCDRCDDPACACGHDDALDESPFARGGILPPGTVTAGLDPGEVIMTPGAYCRLLGKTTGE